MTDFTFDIPERYDAKIADDGVWFSIIDENERLWGEFKCAMFDTDSRRIKLIQDRIKTRYAREIRLKTVDNEALGREVFLEAILLDWRKVNSNGEPVDFSAEAAKAYFSNPKVAKFALPALIEYAQDVRNFQALDKEEVAGN